MVRQLLTGTIDICSVGYDTIEVFIKINYSKLINGFI